MKVRIVATISFDIEMELEADSLNDAEDQLRFYRRFDEIADAGWGSYNVDNILELEEITDEESA